MFPSSHLAKTVLFIGACVATAYAPLAEPAGPQHEAQWKRLGSEAGCLQCPMAVAPDGTLYIAQLGESVTEDRLFAQRVLKWTGAIWQPLGAEMAHLTSLIVDPNGKVLANGNPVDKRGAPRSTVAQWLKQTWSPLGKLDLRITTMANGANGSVYVVGWRTNRRIPQGRPDMFFAEWDGATWTEHRLRTGTDISRLAASPDGEIYGAMTIESRGRFRSFVAKWDGSSWKTLGSEVCNDETISAFVAVAPDGTPYSVCGFFQDRATMLYAHTVQKWNGSAWTSIGTHQYGDPRALAFSPKGQIYLLTYNQGQSFDPVRSKLARTGSRSQVFTWSGSEWSAVGPPLDDLCVALAVSKQGQMYVEGDCGAFSRPIMNDLQDRLL